MNEIVEAVLSNKLTAVAVVILMNFGFVLAIMKEWIVLGSTYKEEVEEKKLWRTIALQNGKQADRLLENKDLGVALLESFEREKS